MDFGKPDDPGAVDWALPPDGALAAECLPGARADGARAYIGSTAWGQREFVGEVYPAGTKPADYLAAYGRQFNCVELNATFYRVPDYPQVRRWYAAVPDDFRFCPKVAKGVSQSADLSTSNARALDFAKAVQHFGHKLGPCFMQLPRDFATDRIDVLRAFLERWPAVLRLAVELRHPSWFGDTPRGLDLFAELGARGMGAVITDVGARRDAAHMHVTADFACVRWVGTAHPSDEGRLVAWADRLAEWLGSGLREAYFFIHQPDAVAGGRSAARFARLLRARLPPEVGLRGPRLAAGGADGAPGAYGPLDPAPTLFS